MYLQIYSNIRYILQYLVIFNSNIRYTENALFLGQTSPGSFRCSGNRWWLCDEAFANSRDLELMYDANHLVNSCLFFLKI